MHYVYLIRSISYPDECYRGNTVNLKQRLVAHNLGKKEKQTLLFYNDNLQKWVDGHGPD